MARIRLNLKNLTIPEKIAKGRQIVTAMTNHTSFANPTPALADVTARLDQLEKAFGSVQAAKSEVSTRVVTQDNATTEVDQILTQLAGSWNPLPVATIRSSRAPGWKPKRLEHRRRLLANRNQSARWPELTRA